MYIFLLLNERRWTFYYYSIPLKRGKGFLCVKTHEQYFFERREIMKRLFILIPVFILVLATAGFSQVTLPITDNFPSTGAEQSWSDYDSSYEVIESFSPTAPSGDGYVMNVNDGSGWQYIHLTDDDGSLGDYAISAYLYMESSDGTNWGRIGLFGRGTSIDWTMDHYYIFADTDGDDYLRVGRYYGGSHSNWDNYLDEDYISRDTWHKFELILDGTTITGKIDDAEEYTGSDATDFTSGYFGILNMMDTTSAPTTLCDRITIDEISGVDDWSMY